MRQLLRNLLRLCGHNPSDINAGQVGEFLATSCDSSNANAITPAALIYEAFCAASGSTLSYVGFSHQMKLRGFSSKRFVRGPFKSRVGFCGLKLTAPNNSQMEG